MCKILLALSLIRASLAGVPPDEPLDAWLASHRLGSFTKSFQDEGILYVGHLRILYDANATNPYHHAVELPRAIGMNTIEARRFQRALHLLLLSPRAKAGDDTHTSAHRTSPASPPASPPAAVQRPVVGVDDLDHFEVAGLSMDELILRIPNRTLARVLLRQLREVEGRLLQHRGHRGGGDGLDGRDGGEDGEDAGHARDRGGGDGRDGEGQGRGGVSYSYSDSNNGGVSDGGVSGGTDGGSNGGSISRRRRTAHDRRHATTASHDGAEGSTTASPPAPTPTTPASQSDEEEESRPRTGTERDWMRRMRRSTLVDIIRTWGGEPGIAAERLIQSYPN